NQKTLRAETYCGLADYLSVAAKEKDVVVGLSEYKMQEKSHTIIQLPIHLPKNQTVYFNNGNEAEALDSLQAQNTMLTAWFELNKQDTDAKKIIYHNIPLFYTFDTKTRLWKKRTQYTEKIIGRMYTVSLSNIERFSLRLLLLYTPAALARELLDDNNEWIKCIDKAAQWQMPKELRQLFALVLIWIALFLAYQNINQKLAQFQKSLEKDFNISLPLIHDTISNEEQIDKNQEYEI
ncbi:14931_t:CDS:2, partial [Dentiscutata erythropus]